MATPLTTASTRRRVVLVDFDWEDANLIPGLLTQPGLSVRLVAGASHEDPGVRLAEICGLPRTVDLADLTREIFDLALVGERSPRRTQIEGLLLALGTPSLTPQSFASADESAADTVPAVEAPLALHAAALETTLGGGSFDQLIEQALPDLSDDAPTSPPPVIPRGEPRFVIPSLEEFPSPEGRRELESALRALMSDTGAGSAELRVEGPAMGELRLQVGPDDALLKGLVQLAQERGAAQVVESLAGPVQGLAWGAWPFRTARHRGILAAAGITPAEGWERWQKLVEDLRGTWDQQDREQAGPAFPLTPEARSRWLDAQEFTGRLELSLERHRRDGLRFALHRLDFPDAAPALELLGERLPARIRDTDSICRPQPGRILLLLASPADALPHVRGRIRALWEEAWRETGQEGPAPEIGEERVELLRENDGERFLGRSRDWLAGA